MTNTNMEQQQSSYKEKERIDLHEPRRFKVIISMTTYYNGICCKDINYRFFQINDGSRSFDDASTQK